MKNRTEWLEDRRKGVGGSDIAAIMGVSPWKTAFQVYQEKRKEVKDWSGNEATDWGTRMEPTLRQFYSDTTGREVRLADKILFHKDYPCLLANLDGFTDDRRVVELKTSRTGKGWGEPGTNQVPDSYTLQVQHYMLVTGFPVADIVVSIGGALPVLYEIPEDLELQGMIVDAASAFWQRVLDGDPPPPVTFSDAVARFGKSEAVGSLIANQKVIKLVNDLRGIREQAKVLEAQEEEIKGKLIITLGESGDELIDPEGNVLVTYKLSKGRVSFALKGFQKLHPELYKQFTITGEASRRFLLKGEKS